MKENVSALISLACVGALLASAASTAWALDTAEQVAQKKRAGLQCPAPPPISAGPVHADILGARPGMGYDDAVRVVLCSDALLIKKDDNGRGVRVDTHGHKLRLAFEAVPAEREKTGREYMEDMQGRSQARGSHRLTADLEPGRSRWFVTSFGLPGQERVLHLARRERYPSEQAPSVEAVEQALIRKYGAASQRRSAPQSNASLGAHINWLWVFTPQGERLAPAQADAITRCGIGSSPDAPVSFKPNCGIAISARVNASPRNEGIAEYLEVSSIDHQHAVRLLETAEKALASAATHQRDQEVEKAKQRGAVPRL